MFGEVYALTIDPGNFAPAKFASIATFVNLLLPLAYILSALFILIFGIKAGYIYLTAGDNPEKIQQGKQSLQWIFVGFVLVISSWLIIKIIGIIFSIKLPI